jgi:hypothetical protein
VNMNKSLANRVAVSIHIANTHFIRYFHDRKFRKSAVNS